MNKLNSEQSQKWKQARDAWISAAEKEISAAQLPQHLHNLCVRGAARRLDEAYATADAKADGLAEGLATLVEIGSVADGRQGSKQLALATLAATLSEIGTALSSEDMTQAARAMSGNSSDVREETARLRASYSLD